MKSPRDRAIDIAHEMLGSGLSRAAFLRAAFLVVSDDSGLAGSNIRKAIDLIERGIRQDRADVAKAASLS